MTNLEKHPFPADPIREIWVKGSPRDIGRQHAEAVGARLHDGMPRFYFDFWKRMSKGTVDAARRPGRAMALLFLDQVVIRGMHRQVPEWAFDRLRGMAEASGREFRDLALALVLPDLFPLLQIWFARLYPQLFLDVEFPPLFGCTSYFARGDRFLFGRNLDFPGVGYWDRFPVLQVTEPRGKLRYVAFTSAGVPLGGITGVNEAQISVSLHQHYSHSGSLRGKLPFLIAEQILMEARSVGEALDLLGRAKVATSWAFLIGDGKTREAVIYETHSRGGRPNPLQKGHLAHANFFQTPECRVTEFATSTRMNWDNFCRKSRLDQLLEESAGSLTPERAVQILSDHYDPYWGEEKPFNRTISQVYNIQSVVMDLEAMTFWMAEGDSPLHLRQFREYSLGDLFAGRSGRKETTIPAYPFQSTAKKEAKELFIRSFIHAFDGDYGTAERYLRQCLQTEFVPEAALICGALNLKASRFREALDLFAGARQFVEEKARAKGREKLPPEYFEMMIYSARTHDLLGERGKAVALYDQMLGSPALQDANFRRIARERKVYRPKHLERILMPYSSYIPFQ